MLSAEEAKRLTQSSELEKLQKEIEGQARQEKFYVELKYDVSQNARKELIEKGYKIKDVSLMGGDVVNISWQ